MTETSNQCAVKVISFILQPEIQRIDILNMKLDGETDAFSFFSLHHTSQAWPL